MLRIIIIAIILLFGYNSLGNCNPIPNPEFASILNITNNINTNTKSVEFNITFSNNELLKVNLSFEFMRQASASAATALPPPPPPTATTNTSEWVELITVSSTPSPPTTTTTTANDEDNVEDNIKVTVDEVIALFQANLIGKEKNIGGILPTVPFYRHFNLQYKESAISIRCLYKSNYEKKALNIKCTQYIETTIIERLLANGEIEQSFVEKTPTP